MRRHPVDRQESVAVVTMSRTQQELIEELFDRKTKEWPDTASALESFKPSAPVIIRNLENIQGDERDVVIISFTYGPDVATGKVAQRFALIISCRRLAAAQCAFQSLPPANHRGEQHEV